MRSRLRLFVIALAFSVSLSVSHATSPDQDIDGDGIPDVREDGNGNGVLDAGETDPYNADSDRGGESDGSEIKAGRNPLDGTDDFTADTDGDGWPNGIEILRGTNPKNGDSDNDGVRDSKDPFPLDAKYSVDADQNGLPDVWEQQTQLNQLTIPQSKVDDPDGDGLNNAQEFAKGTSPTESDTDRDGVDDKTETESGANPGESACLEYTNNDAIFEDMAGHWAEDTVSLLQSTLILPEKLPLVRGYETARNAIFAPDQAVTRFEFLKMALLSTCTHLISATEREKPFSDVPHIALGKESTDKKLRRQVIYTAEHFAIVDGYPDGTFKPDAPVNRAEAVKMLMLAAQIVPNHSTGTTLPFQDVTEQDWFSPFVETLAEREIISGYTDGTFKPGQPITRAEAAKIIALTMRQNPLVNGYVLP